MTFLLYLRDPNRNVGGPVVPGLLEHPSSGAVGRQAEALLAESAEVVFLVHGFNVSRDSGISHLEAFASHLVQNEGRALVAVLWPGDSWAGSNAYAFEGVKADDSAAALVKFVYRVLPVTATLNFASHSLGTRLALEAINQLAVAAYPLGQACLMAGAVNDFVFADKKRYEQAAKAMNRVSVLSSEADDVLKYAYPAGNLLDAFIHWNRELGFALGLKGAKNPVVPTVQTTAIPIDRDAQHGDYLPNFPKSASVPPGKDARNQLSACQFADAALIGSPDPRYP